jgi:hypothetical protein
MSQADTPPVIRPYAGQLQAPDEKGSMHDGLIWARTLPGRRQFLCAPIWRSGATPGSTSNPRWVTGLVGSLRARSVLVGFSTFGVSPLQRTELADRAHACRCARRADGPRLFGPAGVIHPPAGRGDLL